jgi:hypothetical protein
MGAVRVVHLEPLLRVLRHRAVGEPALHQRVAPVEAVVAGDGVLLADGVLHFVLRLEVTLNITLYQRNTRGILHCYNSFGVSSGCFITAGKNSKPPHRSRCEGSHYRRDASESFLRDSVSKPPDLFLKGVPSLVSVRWLGG